MAGWAAAWPTRDSAAVAALYAVDATFFSHPFRERRAPGEYAAWAFEDQESVETRFGEPICHDDRAAVDWWAVITSSDGEVETIAGVSLLRFGADGHVEEQRDVWAATPGRVDPASWAR